MHHMPIHPSCADTTFPNNPRAFLEDETWFVSALSQYVLHWAALLLGDHILLVSGISICSSPESHCTFLHPPLSKRQC